MHLEVLSKEPVEPSVPLMRRPSILNFSFRWPWFYGLRQKNSGINLLIFLFFLSVRVLAALVVSLLAGLLPAAATAAGQTWQDNDDVRAAAESYLRDRVGKRAGRTARREEYHVE